SSEVKKDLKTKGIIPDGMQLQNPSFNYIGFIRYLEIGALSRICKLLRNNDEIKSEIYRLFINCNTRYNYVHVPVEFDYPIHSLPGSSLCFSKLQTIHCTSDNTNN